MTLIDNRKQWHHKVTDEAVMAACETRRTTLNDPGFCLACGLEYNSGLTPDARNIKCEACGDPEVFGVEELVMEIL